MAELDGPRWGPRSDGRPAQLVVLCHGVGADGNDLIELAPLWAPALPEAAFVAPHAPHPYDAAPFGRQWFSIADLAPAALEAGLRASLPAFDRFIDTELRRLGLPRDAYALMGFSQGAMMALFSGLRRNPPPRAILAFSGALLASDRLATEMRGRPPVLVVHGEADEVVPASLGRSAERALAAAGVPVEALYCAGLAHALGDAGLSAGALFLQKAFSAL
jgi:phospholipase/carboxylesterase